MPIEYLKKNVPNIPKLNKVDDLNDPIIIAHYTGEIYGGLPLRCEWWIIAGQDVSYCTSDGGKFKDFCCFGIAKILVKEMGEFNLLCDICNNGGILDKNWEPIPLSEFNWD